VNQRTAPRRGLPVYAAAAVSLVYLALVVLRPPAAPGSELASAMREAAGLMARSEAALKACREARGLPFDPQADPNGTGLIGVEASEITTSAGRLDAKRTTTNPAFAALVTSLLRDAGVRRGDAVAVGASSSFPALIVATLAAVKVLGAEPLVISSLGASTWGANMPGFTWLDMEDCLRGQGLIDAVPIARAVGGEEDVGADMSPEGRDPLAARLRTGTVPFFEEPDLERNVARRLALYRAAAGDRPIKAFVNIGGSWANLGTDSEVLKVEPGRAARVILPPPSRRGVLQAMAAAGVPVIHLLNVKGLCDRYGLPWDPRPLPEPDLEGLSRRASPDPRPIDLPATALYIAAVALALALAGRRSPI
jgi:poly-gamma-glutamate system protein